MLVGRCLAGDLAAFEGLVEKYKKRAFRVAQQVLRDQEEALDVAQEAFVRAYQSLGRFKGQSAFYTWFFRIVVNLALDKKRQQAMRRRAFGSEDVSREEWERTALSTDPSPERSAEMSERRVKIRQALDAMPEHHRAILILGDIEGMSYREIAEVLGVPVGTVMSRLHHARKRMKSVLGPMLALLVVFLPWLASPAWAQPGVTIGVRIIMATNQPSPPISGPGTPQPPPQRTFVPPPRSGAPIDEQSRPILRQLREVFGYSHYELMDHYRATVPAGAAQRFFLPGGRELEVQPVAVRGPLVRLSIKIYRGGVPELTTLLDVPPGRPALVGGPPHGAGVLIIAITARPE